jgi:hypothetical protein
MVNEIPSIKPGRIQFRGQARPIPSGIQTVGITGGCALATPPST